MCGTSLQILKPSCFTPVSLPKIRVRLQRLTHMSVPVYMSHRVSSRGFDVVDSSPARGADAADTFDDGVVDDGVASRSSVVSESVFSRMMHI